MLFEIKLHIKTQKKMHITEVLLDGLVAIEQSNLDQKGGIFPFYWKT